MNTTTSSSARGFGMLALLFATTAWGGLFHAGKQVLTRLDPFWFTTLRYAAAVLLLAALLLAGRHRRGAALRRHAPRLALYGLLGYGMFGILVFVGLARSQPSHGAVIMATLPLSALFVRWLLDGARPAWWAWASALLALLGVSFVSGAWHGAAAVPDVTNTVLGDAIAYVGTLGWVFYTRGQARVPELSVLEYTGYTAVLAWPGLLAIALLATAAGAAHMPRFDDVAAVAPAFLYIAVVATVAAALAFNHGVRTLGAVNGVVFINWVPVSALLIGWWNGHVPSTAEWLGTALVVASLLLFAQRSAAALKSTPPRAAPSPARTPSTPMPQETTR
jgi:drug/metabolite transporter (DMT)-like permease